MIKNMLRDMLKVLIGVMLLLPMVSCKHASSHAELDAAYGNDATDALILSDSFIRTEATCRYHLANLFGDALSDGLLRNGALTGLGTDNPVGKKLKADSLYFQGVRIASIMDWELGKRLQARESGCLPGDIAMQLAVLPRAYSSGLSHPFPDDVAKWRHAAAEINTNLKEFDVVGLDMPAGLGAWPIGPSYGRAHLQALQAGIAAKLAYASRATTQTSSELERLKGLAASYNPLLLSAHGDFRGGASASFYTEAYLPPFYELSASNWDDIFTWKLTRGLKKRPLKLPINISVATLTHVSYLSEGDASSQPLMKVQLLKDFGAPDQLQMRIVFGRLAAAGPEGGPVPMDYQNYRDSFYISFYPNVAVHDSDGSQVRALKEQFNAIANQIKIDARIHQLTLNLARGAGSANIDNLTLRPHFSLKDSDISFRMHRFSADATEKTALQAAGFKCQAQNGLEDDDCFYDFGAYTDLRDFILAGDQGVAHGRLTTLLATRFKELLSAVTRYNVKFIVDWNMRDIEAAIDQELAAIIDDIVSDQAESRRKIQDRLEARLFAD